MSSLLINGSAPTALQLADSLSDVSSVDITKITPASDFDALGLWDASGSAHLKDLGYSTTALTLWSQLARDEPSDSYSTKLPSYQAVAAQADGFYRPDFALGTFTSLGPVTVAMTIQNPNVTPPGGTKVHVKITQDGIGARAITWDTRFVFTTAFSNTGNTAGKYTVCEFVCDGTNFLSLQPNVWM